MLKIGEEIRRALSNVFMRGETHEPLLDSGSITVSEVRVAPDMKNATVYVMPLAGEKRKEIMIMLDETAPRLRKLVADRVELRYTPKLHFKLDTSFEEAGRIAQLLNDPKVKRDVE
jgi:ribosome-binding factor A